jgi:hypothetical protein
VTLGFFGEESLLGSVSIEQFAVAGFPDAVENCCCEAVDGEYLAATISEIDEYKHLNAT